jgi:hypothetical protein
MMFVISKITMIFIRMVGDQRSGERALPGTRLATQQWDETQQWDQTVLDPSARVAVRH